MLHIGHDCKFLYMIKQDGKGYRLSETVEKHDLGVLVQSDLGMSSQCTEAAKKAMKILGIIRRQFKNMDKDTFLIKVLLDCTWNCHPSFVSLQRRY